MTAVQCPSGKVRHPSKRAAKAAATAVGRRRTHDRPRAYECPTCHGWHMTTAPRERARARALQPPQVASRAELDAFFAAHGGRS